MLKFDRSFLFLALVATAFAVAVTPAIAGPVSVGGSGGLGQPGPDPLPPNTLWYNGNPDGNNSYINQNNDQSGVGDNQIIYNQFNATGNWTINSVWSNDIFGNGPPASTTASWEIRSNMPTGTLVASGDDAATLTPTGFSVFGLPEYMVEVSGLNVSLSPGTYWLAVWPDNTNGSFAGNDSTSGAAAVGTPAGNGNGFFSQAPIGTSADGPPFNGGGPNTSAGVAGVDASAVPEPASLTLFGLGAFGMAAYRWRRRRTSKTDTAA